MNPDHSSIRSLEAKNPPPRGRTATDGTRAANEPKRIETTAKPNAEWDGLSHSEPRETS